jgi:hypothetical protein
MFDFFPDSLMLTYALDAMIVTAKQTISTWLQVHYQGTEATFTEIIRSGCLIVLKNQFLTSIFIFFLF